MNRHKPTITVAETKDIRDRIWYTFSIFDVATNEIEDVKGVEFAEEWKAQD